MSNEEEIRSALEQVRAMYKAQPELQGKTDDEIDEEILDDFLKAMDEGKLDKESLLGLMEIMGYEPTEEFEKALEDGPEGGEDAAESELEDARTIGEGESAEEFKDKVDDMDKIDVPDKPEGPKAPEGGEDEDDEDAQREQASKIFGTDLRKNKE